MADNRPNILFVLSDQHNAKVLGHKGHPDVLTPNLDKLAKVGMRMTNAHSSASYDLPSRYAILTGRYGFRHEMLNLEHATYGSPAIDPLRLTLPILMQRAGYKTFMSGNAPSGENGKIQICFIILLIAIKQYEMIKLLAKK